MEFASIKFILFVIVALALYHSCKKTAFQPWVVLLINVFFVASYMPTPMHAFPLLSFLVFTYFLVRLLFVVRRQAVLGVAVVLTVLYFMFLKQYEFASFIKVVDYSFVTVGLSYILFRVIHLMVDAYGRSIEKKIGFVDFLNYTCFFPGFVSGPIMQYQSFVAENEKSRLLERLATVEVRRSFSRITNGFIKIIGFSALFSYLHNSFDLAYWYLKVGEGELVALAWFAFASSTYFAHLYFNFSGYMDVVLGVATLFGYRLPENFDRPFRSRSFLEFWSRWHITLSQWFKAYLFNPLLKMLSRRWTAPGAAPYLGVIGYFATFFVVGYWHVPSFALALLLAVGASVNKLYQVWMRYLLGKKNLKRLNNSRGYQYIGQGLTVSYMAVTLTFLWVTLDELLLQFEFGRMMAIAAGVWVLLGLLISVMMFLYDGAQKLVAPVGAVALGLLTHQLVFRSWVVVKLFVVSYIVAKTVNPAPSFVYMGF